MSQYRLHIDIPLGNDEDKAIEDAKFFIETLTTAERVDTDPATYRPARLLHGFLQRRLARTGSNFQMNYRLGHDEDRQKSNYLMKNEEGHVNNKKCRLTFNDNNV
tara:strand:- start:1145 stop:1459 length:315 start_codon:yes stop_codon:yes gene_type:complete